LIDDLLNFPELESEAKLHVLETQRRLQEITELRETIEELTRDNRRLAAELALFHEEENMSIDDFLGKAPTEKGKPSKELSRQLCVADERLQTTMAENKRLTDELDALRQDFTAAQVDWSFQLKEEQTRIESFKAILRDVEDQAKSQRRTLELEVETLRQGQQTLRDKIHEEFSEQLRTKTDLVAEFDVKLQQALNKQAELNQKLVLSKQQLEQNAHTCDKQQQTIAELGKEKDKLLAETYDIRTSLEIKCTDLHSTVFQLERKLKNCLVALPQETKREESGDSLANLQAKHQLAKREMLKVVGDMAEQKRKFAEAETDHKLELTRLKNALSEVQKVLKLDTFTIDEGDRETLQSKMQHSSEDCSFKELGIDVLGEHVAAITASCDKLGSLSDKTEEGQTLWAELGVIRDHVNGLVRCVASLTRHQNEVSAHLNCISARVYDDASCKTIFRLLLRAVRKCCNKPARPLTKKHKYAQVEVEEVESP